MWQISKQSMICKWTNNSVFSLIAITSIIVVTVTAFYILSLNVQVIPLYFAMTRIENRNVWEEFQKQWFRMLRARIDWKSLLIPCAHANFVKNKSLIGYGKRNETSIEKSFVEYMKIRPAGQFSQIFIRTRTEDGSNKTIGGDFWMVSRVICTVSR